VPHPADKAKALAALARFLLPRRNIAPPNEFASTITAAIFRVNADELFTSMIGKTDKQT
jgi:hypothetical protein